MVDRDEAVRLYAAGWSAAKIAKHFGVAADTARYHLKRAGVQFRDRLEAVAATLADRRPRSPNKWPRSEEYCAAISARRKAAPAKEITTDTFGYLIYTRGPHRFRRVHTVLMEQHIGRRLQSDEVVHHIDEDKQNNALENLQLLTQQEHSRMHRLLDTARGKKRIGLKGEAAPWAKLTWEVVREIRTRKAAGETATQLAPEYGVSRSVVSNILNNKTWKEQ